ncbi:MAG: DUF1223 domain-containing protein [Bacteroidia bacterium]
MMNRKYVLLLLIFLCATKIHAQKKQPEKKQDVQPGFAVVELFTSQGCNTCPPADKILSEIIAGARKNKKPIYAMSFHVDYWNKQGWKDPYSSLKFTNRQKNYSSVLGEREVYTPQVFINGKIAFVGSDKKRLMSEIDKELKISQSVSLKLSKGDSSTVDTLWVDYASSQIDKNFNLYIALVQRSIVTKIIKGENGGKTLTNDNVVRAFETVPVNSLSGTLKIPLEKFSLNADFSIYGYVQQKQTKQILAATGFDF